LGNPVSTASDAAAYWGLFKDAGVDVNLIHSEKAVEALAAGDVDISISSPNRFIGAIAKGLEATIVGPSDVQWSQYMVVNPNNPASRLEDLKPLKLGITAFGSAGHYSAVKVAEALHWPKDSYELVALGKLETLTAGLKSGIIDGFAWSAGAAFKLEEQGDAKVLGLIGGLIGPIPTNVVTVLNSTLQADPAAVKAFCSAYYEAGKRLHADPKASTELFVKEWKLDPTIADKVMESTLPILATSSEITQEMFENMADSTALTIQGAENTTAEEVAGMYKSCDSL
jgi:ABC-type nitrate/sulfonate/bicarbonate transport system substrate-binding protein